MDTARSLETPPRSASKAQEDPMSEGLENVEVVDDFADDVKNKVEDAVQTARKRFAR